MLTLNHRHMSTGIAISIIMIIILMDVVVAVVEHESGQVVRLFDARLSRLQVDPHEPCIVDVLAVDDIITASADESCLLKETAVVEPIQRP